MRKQDKQYIENLATHLIGDSILSGIAKRYYDYKNSMDLRPLLETVLKQKLEKMTAETLGRIIEYSDVTFRAEHTDFMCNEQTFHVENTAVMAEIRALCQAWCGKKLLEHFAMLTLLAVLFDLIKQVEYEQMDDAEWKRAANGEPPVHLVPNM